MFVERKLINTPKRANSDIYTDFTENNPPPRAPYFNFDRTINKIYCVMLLRENNPKQHWLEEGAYYWN